MRRRYDQFDAAPPLPCPAGASPFRVKGHVYTAMVLDFETNMPGGLTAALERFGDADLTRFMRQPFTASGWYDVLPIVPMSEAGARALGRPFHDLVRDRARDKTHRDLRGLYGFIVKLATPEMVARRLPRAAIQYFDFVEVAEIAVRLRLADFAWRGVPAMLVPWLNAATSGFVPIALELAGAQSPRIRLSAPEPAGERNGIPTVTVPVTLSWT